MFISAASVLLDKLPVWLRLLSLKRSLSQVPPLSLLSLAECQPILQTAR